MIFSLALLQALIGGVFAGDLITLFLWWEGTAVASVFLIWARRTPASFSTGIRYLLIQVLSGVLLLAGLLLHYHSTGSIAFDHLGLVSVGTGLIFLSFGIKCAFPFLHNWLQDAYPAATVTGTVVLSAFTTKTKHDCKSSDVSIAGSNTSVNPTRQGITSCKIIAV